jgi:hypothetical protein
MPVFFSGFLSGGLAAFPANTFADFGFVAFGRDLAFVFSFEAFFLITLCVIFLIPGSLTYESESLGKTCVLNWENVDSEAAPGLKPEREKSMEPH